MSDQPEVGASNEMPTATTTGTTTPTTVTMATPSDATATAAGAAGATTTTTTSVTGTTTVAPPTPVVTTTATTTTTTQANDFEVTVAQNGHLSPAAPETLSNGNGAAGDATVPPSVNSTQPTTGNFVAHHGHIPVHSGGGSHGNQGHFHHGQGSGHRVSSPNTNTTNLHRPPSSNHRGHSPHRYSPNAPHSRGNSPHNHNTPAGQQHVVLVHVNPGETFSVRVGDQIQHIQGKML